MQVYEKIFKLLSERQMSQKEFSRLSGIAESTISDWKKKKLNPGIDKVPAICEALNISPYELLEMDSSDSIILSEQETYLVESFRRFDDNARERILLYADKIKEINGGIVDVPDAVTDIQNKKLLARKLRKLARLDRIQLDESEHTSRLNLHLFKYLDYLEIDRLEFIKEYLQHIQPFMITEIKEQEKFENAICVLDEYYRISVYIKVDATKGEEIIVSFHENNKHGIAKKNSLYKRDDMLYVFADSIGSHLALTDTYSINLFIMRGVRIFPLNIAAMKYDEDGFLVKARDITNALLEVCNNYLEDLYTSDLDFSNINIFSSLQQLSFTSYGNDPFSNISLLIDSILIQTDYISKQISDAALLIYCDGLEMLESDKRELIKTIKERFSVNSSRILPEIIERIELNIN